MNTASSLPAPPGSRLDKTDWIFLLIIAILGALLNMAKPMTVDDAPYLTHAIQIAAHPLDPFGYTYTFTDWPERGLVNPAPPSFSYYLALGVKIFGDQPILLKLWVWPWFILLAWSCLKLLKPWAGPWALPAAGALLMGPTFLPSVNLMLDIPAAALTIAGIALLRDHLVSPSRITLSLALLAIALAPLAKYTGASAVAAAVLLCLCHRRYALAALCALVPVALFASWEAFVYAVYHTTHFGYQTATILKSSNLPVLFQGFFLLTWAMSPFLLPLAAISLSPSSYLWVPTAFLSLALYPVMAAVDIPAPLLYAGSALIWLAIGWAAFRLLKPAVVSPTPSESPAPQSPTFSIDTFLILWLAGELLLMFVISPFPASRRLTGCLLVATFILARFAARRLPAPPRLAAACLLAGALSTSLIFYAADYAFANATPSALARFIHEQSSPSGRLYVLGRWTIPYYAPRMGVQEIILDQTQLKPGDQVLIVSGGMFMPSFTFDESALIPQETYPPAIPSPLDTSTTYGGPLGLRHTPDDGGPRFTRYLVTQPAIIRSNPSEAFMRRALLPRRTTPNPLAAWPLVDYAIKSTDPFDNDFAKKLLQYGEPFLSRALDHPSPQARAWTIILLAKNPNALTPALTEKVAALKSDPHPKVRDLAEKLTGQ